LDITCLCKGGEVFSLMTAALVLSAFPHSSPFSSQGLPKSDCIVTSLQRGRPDFHQVLK
jgi:hypothetical protein